MRSLVLLLLLPYSALATYDFTCNLFCYNGGQCRHGKGKFGTYAETPEESEELPWEATGPPKGVGMFCACPAGFTGLQCEIAMKVCPEGVQTCFNGQACAKETDMDGKLWWRCECDVENTNFAAAYVPKYCKKISTVFCNKNSADFSSSQMSYCTNGGQCKKKDHEGQKAVGCICQEGYGGSKCETITYKGSVTMNEVATTATSNKSVGFIVGVTLAVVFGITGFLLFRDQKKKRKIRRRRRLENAGIQTSETFQAKSDAEVI